MKRKTSIFIISIIFLVVLLIPIKNVYKDGGTITYSAALYKVVKWHKINVTIEGGYKTGTEVFVFPKNLFDWYNLVDE